MRQKSSWYNPQYIVNLTQHLVGREVLRALQLDNRGRNTRALLLALDQLITSKLKEMTPETLGRICEYGTEEGFHRPPMGSWGAEFLNCTGFRDVVPNGFTHKDGRGLLEEMALATIVCVARDILLQDHWQKEAEEDRASEHAYERAQHSALHPGRHNSR